MQRVLANCVIVLVSIKMVLSQSSPRCPLYTWQCKNGQCIKFEDLCDGNYDCDDKSDESVEECLLRPCPSYAFQCAYGACITGNFKCNGVINCVDGSDETRYLCEPQLKYENEMQGNCRIPSSMECRSGECISSEKLCDGHTDCLDGSDETVEVCSFLRCPEYSFRCGYGACVPGVAACNGINDCKDGSDEIASICSNITNIATPTVRPLPTSTTSTTTKPLVITTSTTSVHTGPPTRPPSSEKHCSTSTLVREISTVPSCYYQGSPVNCYRDLRVGTTATVVCATGYVEKQANKRNNPPMKCDADGEWTRPKGKCIPECGTLTQEQKESTSKPWEVTIMRRDYAPIFMPICSGVIVSPKIVLTAANCFLSYNNAYYTDHVFYNLVEGYYNQSYISGSNLNVNIHNISSISIKNMHRTKDLAVLVLVNYFQFNRNLKPICLPTAQSNIFPFHSENKLNIGRPIARDPTNVYLEYLIAGIEEKPNGRKTLSYVNIIHYIPFINREIKKYEFIL